MPRSWTTKLIAFGMAIVALAGCRVGEGAGPTTCYPSWPRVTPAVVRAGASVTVQSEGIRDCTYVHRMRSYGLRLQTKPIGLTRTGVLLGTVSVGRQARLVRGQVQIPVGTPPGRYYVKYGRAPTDHYRYRFSCDDVKFGTSAPLPGDDSIALISCGVASPNLTVVG